MAADCGCSMDGWSDWRRDLVSRFVEAHRELSNLIKQHPQEAQTIIRDELKASFRASMPPELIARAWTHMSLTSDISPTALQTFVTNAQQVGLTIRSCRALSRCRIACSLPRFLQVEVAFGGRGGKQARDRGRVEVVPHPASDRAHA